MCINMRYIYNKYTKRNMLVKCGKCPSCLQEKANKRTNRLKVGLTDEDVCLFFTLTYKNMCVPYIQRNDLIQAKKIYDIICDGYKDDFNYSLHVYRDVCLDRPNFRGKSNIINDKQVIEKVLLNSSDLKSLDLGYFSDLNKKDGCIGVLYFKDIQDFKKRFRQNLKRHYGIGNIRLFTVSEYGSRSLRPHFHGLIYTPFQTYNKVICAFNESWPYDDCNVKFKSIDIARDAASYCASYLNCGSRFPVLFTKKNFQPKCSYSLDVGFSVDSFQLYSILENLRRRVVTYPRAVVIDNVRTSRDFPMPQYVVNRFFRKFKGYCRLTTFETLNVLRTPKRYAQYAKYLNLSLSDIHKNIVQINNQYERFIKELKLSDNIKSREKFALSFISIWHELSNYTFKEWYEKCNYEPTLFDYDNWSDIIINKDKYNSLVVDYVLKLCSKTKNYELYDNPNSYPDNLTLTDYYSSLYEKKQKIKKVTNFVLSKNFNL